MFEAALEPELLGFAKVAVVYGSRVAGLGVALTLLELTLKWPLGLVRDAVASGKISTMLSSSSSELIS